MRWSIGARNADLPPGRCASRATARKTMRGLEPAGSMNRFAQLLDRLAFEHGRNAKLRLMTEYFRTTPDPERGITLAALTGALSFPHAKPGIIRALIAERTDPVLFELSYDYVGDVSARLAKTAVAALGDKDPDEIELIWPGLSPPYVELFAWVEGSGEKPIGRDPAPFRPVMLAHAVEEEDLAPLDPRAYIGEWKWDGIRVQAAAGRGEDGARVARLYSRTGEDISRSFPDLIEALKFEGAIDGELLIVRDGRVQSFNMLQQRLNRKVVTPKLMAEFPAHLRAYDLLVEGAEDLRERTFLQRRARLEALVKRLAEPRIDLSPLIGFSTWQELAAARKNPAAAGAGPDAEAVEGVMLKQCEAAYVPGRPRGLWWKWKRGPALVDAVLMYAQRGSGKRSSFYSDYTFGVWRSAPEGEELVQIDRFVRRNTIDRFGPVREVVHEPDKGLVLEIAFEGLQRSARHKSGLAMRFPRINRLRWDKPPGEADRLETLERMLDSKTGATTHDRAGSGERAPAR